MITSSFGLTATERVLPKLALDFTTASLDPRVTFTRASTATRVNSAGLIESVTTNAPRFDYDPVTKQPKGLLIEEQRTNLLTYSSAFDNAVWVKTNATIDSNVVVAPDGTLTADKLVENTATGNHDVYQNVLVTPITYASSYFLKAGERTKVAFRNGASNVGVFDLITGVFDSLTGIASPEIKNLDNGWWRVSFTRGNIDTKTRSFGVFLLDNSGNVSYTGDGYSGIYIWGAQLEAGAFPTSYIPTTTTALTRNADDVSMTGTNFSDWFNATEGTLACKFTLNTNPSLVTGLVSVASNLQNWMTIRNGTSLFGIVVTSNATQAAIQMSNATVQGNTYNGVLAYKANDFRAASNGITVDGTDVSGTVPVCNTLHIGSTAGNNITSSVIKSIYYWPQRLTNNEVLAFSK